MSKGCAIQYTRADEIVTYMAHLQASTADIKPALVLPVDEGLIDVAVNVARSFLSLADALTDEESFAAQVSPTSIWDESRRFEVCCDH
jgi:hypothetical protein